MKFSDPKMQAMCSDMFYLRPIVTSCTSLDHRVDPLEYTRDRIEEMLLNGAAETSNDAATRSKGQDSLLQLDEFSHITIQETASRGEREYF